MRAIVFTSYMVALPVIVLAGFYNREILALKKSALDNKLFSGYVLDHIQGVTTVFRCQAVCLQNIWCDSFFFNKQTALCQTNNKVFGGSETWTRNIGMNYYILQRDESGSLPNSFVSHSLKMNVSFKLEYVAWNQGDSTCRDNGGDQLVSLDTMDKFNFVVDIIKSYRGLDQNEAEFLVGATDYGTEGRWRWHNGAILSTTSPMWCSGQPNNADYIVFSQDYASMRNDAKCGLKLVDVLTFENGYPVCALPYTGV